MFQVKRREYELNVLGFSPMGEELREKFLRGLVDLNPMWDDFFVEHSEEMLLGLAYAEMYKILVEPEAALLYFTTYVRPYSARMHAIMLKQFNGLAARGVFRRAMVKAFLDLDVQRIYVEVPKYNTRLFRAVRALGMKHEGEMRMTILYRNEWWNSDMFSLVRSDVGV